MKSITRKIEFNDEETNRLVEAYKTAGKISIYDNPQKISIEAFKVKLIKNNKGSK